MEKLDEKKQVICDKGFVCSCDKLLIATGAESFIPPVGAFALRQTYVGLVIWRRQSNWTNVRKTHRML